MIQKQLLVARLVVAIAVLCLLPSAHAATWDQPAADLAKQIAALSGPGPARFVLRNDSSIPVTDVPAIRRLLERNLRVLGVLSGGSDSATLIRVTLSENLQGGLWVAEVVEGSETRVSMLPVTLETPTVAANGPAITLRRTLLLTETEPVLDAQIFTAAGIQRLVILEPDRIVSYLRNAAPLVASAGGATGWLPDQIFPIAHTRSFPRDLRGRLVAAPNQPTQDQTSQAHLFDAWLPGVACTGSMAVSQLAVTCQESDDPWPITASQHAFYNAMRDYFTGILAPGYGMDLPPFYAASDIPRASGSNTLLNGIDGRVLLIENNVLRPVNGANDWGSDMAVLRSGCGSGAQVLVSGSGAASGAASAGDSLRAWEIVGREAVPVSAPLSIDGTVMAIQGAPDGTAAIVIVRREAPARDEVWNASALCN
ncbi:MAG TPA: hypothetical protein VHX37_13745 [Acidobacteriaceae bacterium]|jgi:hypothetical protein|nr:hypothetical protein [Acidobacteriaceae bacterium]